MKNFSVLRGSVVGLYFNQVFLGSEPGQIFAEEPATEHAAYDSESKDDEAWHNVGIVPTDG